MKPSHKCIGTIKKFEGCRLSQYADAAGLPTIGWGHKVLKIEGLPTTITQEKADELLDDDAAYTGTLVDKSVTVPLTQGQFDALVDFTYNLGIGRLRGSTLLALVNAGKYDTAELEFHKWVYGGGKVLPGLVTRREAEQDLWRS